MEILELLFLYEGADTEFHLGFFTSMETAERAMGELRKLPGFCDHPKGFFVEPHTVQTQRKDLTKIYAALVSFFPTEYHGGNYTEYSAWLGFYEAKKDADRAVRRYLDFNPEEIPGLDRNCIAQEYRLDQISGWEEGFTTDYFPE